jgi:hypothetical protein
VGESPDFLCLAVSDLQSIREEHRQRRHPIGRAGELLEQPEPAARTCFRPSISRASPSRYRKASRRRGHSSFPSA